MARRESSSVTRIGLLLIALSGVASGEPLTQAQTDARQEVVLEEVHNNGIGENEEPNQLKQLPTNITQESITSYDIFTLGVSCYNDSKNHV